MTASWKAGEWVDVCATSTGYALVIVSGMDVICYTAATPGAIPVEVWRVTSTMPISFIRCACRTDTDEVRAIGMGTSMTTGAKTAQLFDSTGQTAKGTAFGDWPVLLQYTTDWVGYIARTAKTYTRWPISGAEPAAVANPFTLSGSTMGMIQVIGSTVTWREFVPQTAASVGQPRTTTVSGVVFRFPMVVGGVTVGQSIGGQVNAPQIIAAHDTSELSTIFAMEGETPHVAELSDGSFAIACRTLAVTLPRPVEPGTAGDGRAGWAVDLPPWPDYDATAQQGPDQLKMPWDQKVTTPSGIANEQWQKAWKSLADRVATPVNLQGIAASGQGGGGGGGGGGTPTTVDADVLVGTDTTGVPNARLPIDTATVEWDMTTPGEYKANVPPGSVVPLFYMSPLTTGGDPATAELVFGPDGDVVDVPKYF